MAADLAALQHAMEQACDDLQHPSKHQAAESTLLQLRTAPNALHICRHILQHSHSLAARFQAATAVREAAVRQWPALSIEYRRALRQFLLQLALSLGSDTNVVTRAVTSALASVVKRGWLDEQWRTSFFTDLHAASGPALAAPQLRVLEALVHECAPETASTMSMPWGFHEKCKASLQDTYLQQFFQHALQQASAQTDPTTTLAALQCMSAILAWDFRGASHGGRWGSQRFRGGTESLHIRPGPDWRPLLVADPPLQLLESLLPQLQGRGGEPAAAAARHLLVQLCGLDGDVFPSEDSGARTALLRGERGVCVREHYVARLLPLVVALAPQPEATVAAAARGDGVAAAELMDCCRCANAAAAGHSLRAFDLARTPPPGVLSWLTTLTCAVLAARADSACGEDDELHTMSELLLEAWVALLEPESHVSKHQSPSAAAPTQGPAAQGCCAVFQALLAGGLQAAAAGAHEDAGEDDVARGGAGAARAEDWMTRMAALGRVVPDRSLLLLHAQLQQHQQALLAAASAGQDIATVLEQLCWLMQLAGFVLADPGHGETPLPPLSLMGLTEHSDPNIIVMLSSTVLETATLPLNESLRPLLSPALMESALWAASRWGATYLCPEEPLPRALEGSFGRPGQGPALVERLLQSALLCLTGFPAEAALQGVVASQLLPMLVRHRALCQLLVDGSAAWQALAAAAGSHSLSGCGLAPAAHRALLQHVALAAQGCADKDRANQYTSQLYEWALSELTTLASVPDVRAALRAGNTAHLLEFVIDALRGVAAGSLPTTQPAQLALLQSVMRPMSAVQRAVVGNVLHTTMVFELAGDLLEAQQTQLQPAVASELVSWVVQLLAVYGGHRGGQVSLATRSAAQAAEAVDEVREELGAVLRVLTQLLQRDVASLQPDACAHVAKAALLGLDHIIPVLTPELLAAPSLGAALFSLLAYLAELFPDHVAGLPGPSFQRLVPLLEFGLQHPEQEVLQQCLEAVAALAGWHVTVTGGGAMPDAGLGLHNTPGADGITPLGRLLHKCLERVLYDPTLDPLEALADALLPLILAERGTYERIGSMLLAGQQDAAMRSVLDSALHTLLVLDGQGAAVDRKAKRQFRNSLIAFAGQARSVVCVR